MEAEPGGKGRWEGKGSAEPKRNGGGSGGGGGERGAEVEQVERKKGKWRSNSGVRMAIAAISHC